MLGYSKFLNLISNIDKNTLFDAVRPEIVKYAEHKYVNIGASDAYRAIFEKAFRSTGGEGGFPSLEYDNAVADMRKKKSGADEYRANIRYAHWFYYFSLFSPECTDPHYGERISHTLFDGESFFDAFERDMQLLGIQRPIHLPPLRQIHLGPIRIATEVGIPHRNFSSPDLKPLSPSGEAEPSVLTALHWRSGLTGLYGRDAEYQNLLNWALADKEKKPKLIVVSGPGGAGKSRLVAGVVSTLIHQHGWTGGLLPKIVSDGDIFSAGGKGVVVVIDYPEERSELVNNILTAITDDADYDIPVRIILASRETLADWRRSFNDPNPDRMEELKLDLVQNLREDEALALIEDATEAYAEITGRTKPPIAAAKAWLSNDIAHCVPLIALAGAIHAVLHPEHAYALSAKDILLALAEVELKRSRSFSSRDIGDEDTLTQLLALSMFTEIGLTKETVYGLNETGLGTEVGSPKLLAGVQNTPYWVEKTGHEPSHLAKLEPDRPAAAYMYLALGLDDPSPSLPHWLGEIVARTSGDFTGRLSRIAYDLALIDPEASKQVEQAAISMLRHKPDLVTRFLGLADKRGSNFSSAFAVDVLERLLPSQSAPDEQGKILNALAIEYSALNRVNQALDCAESALSIYRRLARTDPARYSHLVANAFGTLAGRKFQQGQFSEAKSLIDEELSIHRQLFSALPDTFCSELSVTLANASMVASKLGEYQNSVNYAVEALDMFEASEGVSDPKQVSTLIGLLGSVSSSLSKVGHFEFATDASSRAVIAARELASVAPQAHQVTLARAIANRANLLSEQRKFQEAAPLFAEVVEMFVMLATARPEIFLPDLAKTLGNQAIFVDDLARPAEALAISNRALSILRDLAAQVGSEFLVELARQLTSQAKYLAQTDEPHKALETVDEAVGLFRNLVKDEPETHFSELARSLENKSLRHAALGQFDLSIEAGKESTQIFRTLAEKEPQAFNPILADSLGNFSDRAASFGFRDEALEAAKDALQIIRPLANSHPGIHSPKLARLLNTYAGRAMESGQLPTATVFFEEACDEYQKLTDGGNEVEIKNFALTMKNLADAYAHSGRVDEAYAKARDAVTLYRQLISAEVSISQRIEFGNVLNTFAGRASDKGETQIAVDHAREAVTMFQEAHAQVPGPHSHMLAVALFTLADIFARSGDARNSVAPVKAAIEALGPRFLSQPQQFAPWMKKFVDLYFKVSQQLGREPDKAFLSPYLQELVRILRR